MNIVLDASALLAYLHNETGAARVRRYLPGASMSAVNWAEVVQKTHARGIEIRGMREELVALGLSITPLTAWQAEICGRLSAATRHLGLSLGDRACLALGLDLDVPVLTADKVWSKLVIGLEVRIIR